MHPRDYRWCHHAGFLGISSKKRRAILAIWISCENSPTEPVAISTNLAVNHPRSRHTSRSATGTRQLRCYGVDARLGRRFPSPPDALYRDAWALNGYHRQMPERLESVSTWRQPVPAWSSTQRQRVIDDLASEIAAVSVRRLRVAVGGLTGSGKTSFGHELASALSSRGRPTARASIVDFKHS